MARITYDLILRRSWEWAVKEMEMWGVHIYSRSHVHWHMCVQCTHTHTFIWMHVEAPNWHPSVFFNDSPAVYWDRSSNLHSQLAQAFPVSTSSAKIRWATEITHLLHGIWNCEQASCLQTKLFSCRPSLQSQRDLHCIWTIILFPCFALLHFLLHVNIKFVPVKRTCCQSHPDLKSKYLFYPGSCRKADVAFAFVLWHVGKLIVKTPQSHWKPDEESHQS